MWTLCDSTNINTIVEFVQNACSMSTVMVSMAVLIRTFISGILGGKRRNINLILDVTHGKKSHGVTYGLYCV